jgi:hypothetical protein
VSEPRYELIGPVSRDDAERAAASAPPEALLRVVLAVGLHERDAGWAVAFVIRFASHSDSGVRGSVLECLGHFARRFGALTPHARPLLEAGLRDADSWVRGKADAAADDVEFFLGWSISRSGDSA